MRTTLLRSLLALALATPAVAETFQIDATHSSVEFKIRHLVGRVSGRFDKVQGQFDYEEGNLQAWKASAVIDAASINTANEKRDTHLRNEDFFDVAKCPTLEFVSKEVTDMEGGAAKLHGDLTMHCVTQPVVLDLEVGGVENDPWGNRRAGMTAKGKLRRKAFGITWNKTLDKGAFMLGDEVDIEIEIEGIVKATKPEAEPKADIKTEPAAGPKAEPKKG